MNAPSRIAEADSTWSAALSHRHLRAGWIGLLVFLTLGIGLETLHGLKLGFYLDPRHTARRLMWTLAHSHGTLFSLVNIAFAVTVHRLRSTQDRLLRFASAGLLGGLLVLPLGFFLGGFGLYGGDPGIGVFLVPVGALLMLAGAGAVVMLLPRAGNKVPRPVMGGETRGEAQLAASSDTEGKLRTGRPPGQAGRK